MGPKCDPIGIFPAYSRFPAFSYFHARFGCFPKKNENDFPIQVLGHLRLESVREEKGEIRKTDHDFLVSVCFHR